MKQRTARRRSKSHSLAEPVAAQLSSAVLVEDRKRRVMPPPTRGILWRREGATRHEKTVGGDPISQAGVYHESSQRGAYRPRSLTQAAGVLLPHVTNRCSAQSRCPCARRACPQGRFLARSPSIDSVLKASRPPFPPQAQNLQKALPHPLLFLREKTCLDRMQMISPRFCRSYSSFVFASCRTSDGDKQGGTCQGIQQKYLCGSELRHFRAEAGRSPRPSPGPALLCPPVPSLADPRWDARVSRPNCSQERRCAGARPQTPAASL